MHDRQIAQKAREQTLLEIVLKYLSISPTITARECPDFLIDFDSRSVGIDVTELYVTSGDAVPRQARESTIARVVNRAQQIYELAGGPSLHVSIGFFLTLDPRAHRDSVARELVAIVRELLLQPESSLQWRQTYSDRQRWNLPVSFVSVHRLSEGPSHWTAPQADWVAPVTPDSVRSAIERKTSRLAEYRRAAPEVWLICGYLGRGPSQFLELREDLDTSAIVSPFDRTFVCEGFTGKVREV